MSPRLRRTRKRVTLQEEETKRPGCIPKEEPTPATSKCKEAKLSHIQSTLSGFQKLIAYYSHHKSWCEKSIQLLVGESRKGTVVDQLILLTKLCHGEDSQPISSQFSLERVEAILKASPILEFRLRNGYYFERAICSVLIAECSFLFHDVSSLPDATGNMATINLLSERCSVLDSTSRDINKSNQQESTGTKTDNLLHS